MDNSGAFTAPFVPKNPPQPNTLTCVARLGKTRGLKGEIRAYPLTYDMNRHETLQRVFLLTPESEIYEAYITDSKEQDAVWYLYFAGVDSPEAAAKFTNAEICIPDEERPELPQGEYYFSDLRGLEVRDFSGTVLGKILDVFENGGHCCFEMQIGTRTLLAPWIKDCIGEIYLEQGFLEADADFLDAL
jgi:16S rRNA processing protein RimM